MPIILKKYIDQTEKFIEFHKGKEEKLCSLIFDYTKIDFESILRNLQNSREQFLYTNISEKSFRFLGIGSLHNIEEVGEDRLNRTEKIIDELQTKFISNWDEFEIKSIPLFLGGMKFSIEKPNELWRDFSDSDWFIPKFLFYKKDAKEYLVYNFFTKNENSVEEDFDFIKHIISPTIQNESNPSKIKALVDDNEKAEWKSNVNSALEEIESGKVQKIVLSRKVDFKIETTICFENILSALSERYPRCYVFAFRKNDSTFFGASPEKLAKVSEGWIEADALAGSINRGETEKEDSEFEKNLLNSRKDLAEQNIVVSFIQDSFSNFCDEIYFEKHPVIRKLPNIQHLWTPIKGRIKEDQSIFSILKKLHPTPAICGVPWNVARSSIAKMESYPRGLYTGMIGWFNFYNEGEFAVAIRTALIKDGLIHAFAGCGIVKGSNPDIEYAESELKLKPILSLFETSK